MKRFFCFGLVIARLALATDAAHCVVPDRPAPDQKPKPFTNSIGMKFVWIPPGSFMMGSPKEEVERESYWKADEKQHGVTLTKGFYMGVHLVTQQQWQVVMRNNPSHFQGEENLPVDNVSWEDCQRFIMKLRAGDSRPYRLPTEAEWEYACRAGTATPFHFGETISTDQANYLGDFIYAKGERGANRRKSTAVDSFPANAWGLHDMHGNVYQWCQDWFGAYPAGVVVDPKGAMFGDYRVLRGGAWNSNPEWCRSAYRSMNFPDSHEPVFGFRLCLSAE
jgi:formylglycine-generating enzyme required for sulfatase activity